MIFLQNTLFYPDDRIIFGNDKKILKIGDESNKNLQEFVASPQLLYQNRQRVFLSSMTLTEMNSFCKLFNFTTGILVKNPNYLKKLNDVQSIGELDCRDHHVTESNCRISQFSKTSKNKFIVINCTKQGECFTLIEIYKFSLNLVEIICKGDASFIFENICYYSQIMDNPSLDKLESFCKSKNLTTTHFPTLYKKFILDYLMAYHNLENGNFRRKHSVFIHFYL